MAKRITDDQIFAEFDTLIEKNTSFNWDDVRVAMRAIGFDGNWMQVRGCLQWFKDEGVVVRTKDVHNEIFEVIS